VAIGLSTLQRGLLAVAVTSRIGPQSENGEWCFVRSKCAYVGDVERKYKLISSANNTELEVS